MDKFISNWKTYNGPHYLNSKIVEETQSLSFDILMALLLSDKDLHEVYINRQQVLSSALQTVSDINYSALSLSIFLPSCLLRMYLRFNRKYQKAQNIWREFINDIINRELDRLRQIEKHERTNLIASVVASLQTDEAKEMKKREEEKQAFFLGLSREELFQEILSIIEAGTDPPATAISWWIYYMSKYPVVQEKIKQELMANGITKETYLTNELLEKLQYVDCVVKELLRHAPIFSSTMKTLKQNDEIDGIKLAKGDTVLVAYYNMHKDKRYWKLDPIQFIPERFFGLDAKDKDHHRYALNTFGGGPRQCMGQDLARLLLKTMITRLMQHFTFVDGGPEKNTGRHFQLGETMKPDMAVYIYCD
ncbi:unnamed protein product [Rotaria socialis]